MAHVGYVRVSSVDQNTDRQLEGLTLDKVFTDKASGGSTNRPELKALKEYVRDGDTIHVHSIDRLARSLEDLQALIKSFNNAGVIVQFHREGLTFSGKQDSMQKFLFQVMGAFAEFERSLIRERQQEGIEKAKAKGVYKGGKRQINREEVLKLSSMGAGPSAIAKKLDCSRMQVYRILEAEGVR